MNDLRIKNGMKNKKTVLLKKHSVKRSIFSLMVLFSTLTYTAISQADVQTLGDMALTITKSFEGLAKLITAGAYMAGIGFVMASMLKFKAHKDNPTQIPIGTPIALLFVGSALIFLPHIFVIAGYTIFGGTSGAAGISGTTGLSGL